MGPGILGPGVYLAVSSWVHLTASEGLPVLSMCVHRVILPSCVCIPMCGQVCNRVCLCLPHVGLAMSDGLTISLSVSGCIQGSAVSPPECALEILRVWLCLLQGLSVLLSRCS